MPAPPSADWPAPTPLTSAPVTAASSIDVGQFFPSLIKWAAQYAQAVADEVQVDPLMVVPSMLAVASIAATGACVFDVGANHAEAPVLWTMTLADPSQRKSATLNKVSKPLWVTEPPPSKGRSCSPSYATSKLMVKDITRAGIFEHAMKHDGRLGMLSDEDCIIKGLAKEAGKSGDAVDLYLNGFSGTACMRTRQGVEQSIPSPNIVISLLVQPSIGHLALASEGLVSRGFCQRFLYFRAPSRADRDFFKRSPMPAALEQRWHTCITGISALQRRHKDRRLGFDKDAYRAYGNIANRLDAEGRTSGLHPLVAQWLNRAAGHLCRISGLFALMRSPEVRTIQKADVLTAEVWIEQSVQHLKSLLLTCGADPVVAQAQRVLRWLAQGNRDHASANEITQALRSSAFATVEQWKPVFDLLVTNGWLRPVRVKAAGSQGGRPSLVFEINPALLIGVAA